jgi:hypothetical protein
MVGRSDLPHNAKILKMALQKYGVTASKHTFFTPDSLHDSHRNYINVALRCGVLLDISEVMGEEAYTLNDTGRTGSEILQEAPSQDWKCVPHVGIKDVPLPRKGYGDPLPSWDESERAERAERRAAREAQNEFPYTHGR